MPEKEKQPRVIGDAAQLPPPLNAFNGHDPEVVRRTIELAAAKPPRWVTNDSGESTCTYDAGMHERSMAIDALRHAKVEREAAMRVLIAAFDDFVEPDPDFTYEGHHERVCAALVHWGAGASPVVPRLERYLRENLIDPDDDTGAQDAMRLVVSLGTEAARSLKTVIELYVADYEADQDLLLEPLLGAWKTVNDSQV